MEIIEIYKTLMQEMQDKLLQFQATIQRLADDNKRLKKENKELKEKLK
jgi:hypothetical protein